MIKVNHNFLPKSDIHVLVSGGVDSVVVAHWLKYSYRLKFDIVHFNHCVQDANDEMEEKVFNFMLKMDTGGRVIKRINDGYIHHKFTNTSEAGLREWRHYEMSGIGGCFITAHHLNDAVENYLKNCFEGNPEYTPIPWTTSFKKGFKVFHPFLSTRKKDFIDYADKHNLWDFVVEDPTNKETKQRRNWIRNVIVPELNNQKLGLEKVVRKKFYS